MYPLDTRDLDGNEVIPYADGREYGSMAQHLSQGRLLQDPELETALIHGTRCDCDCSNMGWASLRNGLVAPPSTDDPSRLAMRKGILPLHGLHVQHLEAYTRPPPPPRPGFQLRLSIV